MIRVATFAYKPAEHEAERASNSYVMSLVAMMVGLPLPIINLVATLVFYVGNRRATYFVRWHCTQALLSQFSLVIINGFGFWWTLSILFTPVAISNAYVAYIITLLIFNLVEVVATIYTAVQTRKGVHVEWWFYGSLTNLMCKA